MMLTGINLTMLMCVVAAQIKIKSLLLVYCGITISEKGTLESAVTQIIEVVTTIFVAVLYKAISNINFQRIIVRVEKWMNEKSSTDQPNHRNNSNNSTENSEGNGRGLNMSRVISRRPKAKAKPQVNSKIKLESNVTAPTETSNTDDGPNHSSYTDSEYRELCDCLLFTDHNMNMHEQRLYYSKIQEWHWCHHNQGGTKYVENPVFERLFRMRGITRGIINLESRENRPSREEFFERITYRFEAVEDDWPVHIDRAFTIGFGQFKGENIDRVILAKEKDPQGYFNWTIKHFRSNNYSISAFYHELYYRIIEAVYTECGKRVRIIKEEAKAIFALEVEEFEVGFQQNVGGPYLMGIM